MLSLSLASASLTKLWTVKTEPEVYTVQAKLYERSFTNGMSECVHCKCVKFIAFDKQWILLKTMVVITSGQLTRSRSITSSFAKSDVKPPNQDPSCQVKVTQSSLAPHTKLSAVETGSEIYPDQAKLLKRILINGLCERGLCKCVESNYLINSKLYWRLWF